MADSIPKSLPVLGFLTVIGSEQDSLLGGYLVLNAAGRPLEFHCTAPVRPNRAQRILYGPTLGGYLHGELIGQTLLAKSKIQATAVLTDDVCSLAVREFIDTPAALTLAEQEVADENNLRVFQIGEQQFAQLESHQDDVDELQRRLVDLTDFDWLEPFARIREAIEEAQKAA